MTNRYQRLKCVFEGRKAQLHLAHQGGMPFKGVEQRHQYGLAVTKYVRARTAWRKFRGWE